MTVRWVAVLLSVVVVTGCRAPVVATSAEKRLQAEAARHAEEQAEIESQREQLERIAPPAKSRYMAIHSFESWENPFVTVQAGMLELYVTRGDPNPTPVGVGGMFRPQAARRAEVNVGPEQLGEAISSVPGDAWPYGRVVAIEEAHHVPASAEPAVRRSLEAAVKRLNDLGVVVYDLSEGKVE